MTASDGFPEDLFATKMTRGGPRLEPSRVAFVRWLTKEHVFAAPSDTFGERGFELLLYDAGHFRDGAAAVVHGEVEDAFQHVGMTASQGFRQEVARSIACRALRPRSSFNPPGFLNLANGTYEFATSQLHPHTPDRRFTYVLPLAYDPSAAYPTFARFLEEVLPSTRARREVQKLFGYCLGVPGHPYQCAHVLVGEGNNGKSTLLSVLTALLGKENVAAETLVSLTENHFAPANLWGKLANVCADLPSNPLRYTGMFKALVGGDKIRAEIKFGKTFYYVNQAKLVFSANELPEVYDRTLAFWRRWHLLRFNQDFTGREDRQLLGKLLAELPGVLNWSLAGIPLLDQDGGFLTELGTDDLKAEWRRRSDTVGWFVAEEVVVDPVSRVPKHDLYEAYVDFCARNKATPRSLETVGKELPTHVPSVRSSQERTAAGRESVWRGIRLRSTSSSGGGIPLPPMPPLPPPPDAGSDPSPHGSGGRGGRGSPVPASGPVKEENGNWTVPANDRERSKGTEP